MTDFCSFVDTFKLPKYLSFDDLKYGYKKLGLFKFVLCLILFLVSNKRSKTKKNSNVKRRAVSRNMSISLNRKVDSDVSKLSRKVKNVQVVSSDFTKKEKREALRYGRKKIFNRIQRNLNRKKSNQHTRSLHNRKMSPSRLKRKAARAEKFVLVSNWDDNASILVTDYDVMIRVRKENYHDPGVVSVKPDEFILKYNALPPFLKQFVKEKLVFDKNEGDIDRLKDVCVELYQLV